MEPRKIDQLIRKTKIMKKLNIKYLFNTLIVTMLVGALFSCQQQPATTAISSGPTFDVYEGIEFEMPVVKEPVIGNYSVNIKDFGAVSDGLTINTKAFADAIDDVSENGGGKVIIPRGIWLTGPIVLKSNINLHAEEGALVIFSADKDLYPLVETSFEGLETYRSQSPLSGRNLENIAITGKGIFDGSGDAWRFVKKGKMSPSQWKSLVNSGGILSEDGNTWFPSAEFKRGYEKTSNFNVPPFETREQFEEVKEFLRPVLVSLVNCKKVLLDGPTFQNSPAWNIHPLMCEDVTIRNLTVRNPWYSQNGDGLDLESCKNAVIYNNTFDVGDDAICFKSGKNEDGRRRGMPTENVIVKNNIVYHGHGGFVVGSEMSGGVRNVHVSNCTFIGTDVGLRFKSTRGRGGIVENIYISNIDMINIPTDPIRFNMFYEGQSPILEDDEEPVQRDENKEPVTEKTPSFRNIYMKNITSTGGATAAYFLGLPEMKLQNVKIENAVLEGKEGITLIDAQGIEFKNVKVLQKEGPALTIYNSSDVDISQFSYNENQDGPTIRVLGPETSKIKFGKADIVRKEVIFSGKEVPANAVEMQ